MVLKECHLDWLTKNAKGDIFTQRDINALVEEDFGSGGIVPEWKTKFDCQEGDKRPSLTWGKSGVEVESCSDSVVY